MPTPPDWKQEYFARLNQPDIGDIKLDALMALKRAHRLVLRGPLDSTANQLDAWPAVDKRGQLESERLVLGRHLGSSRTRLAQPRVNLAKARVGRMGQVSGGNSSRRGLDSLHGIQWRLGQANHARVNRDNHHICSGNRGGKAFPRSHRLCGLKAGIFQPAHPVHLWSLGA